MKVVVTFCLIVLVSGLRELPYITLHKDANGESVYEIRISQPNVKVTEADQYFCFTKYLEEIGEAYIVSGHIEIDQKYIHHASTGFCEESADFAKTGPWECSLNRDKACQGSIISGIQVDDFTKDSNKSIKYPKDVSIRVGSLARLRYFLYESHFKIPVIEPTHPLVNITLRFIKSPTKYFYQSSRLFASGQIPASMDKGYFAEMACPWTKPKVVAFAILLHTHHHGYMADIFRIRNGTWILLASQLTQGKPNEVAPIIGGFVEIQPGDILAAKCLYINKEDKPVRFGLSDGEEMCNAGVYFGYELKDEDHFTRTGACTKNLPDYSFCKHVETAAICG